MTAGRRMALWLCGGFKLPIGDGILQNCKNHRHSIWQLRWGHIAPHCSESPRCALCAEGHTTHDHQCSIVGCKAVRGHGCTHVTTQCANCKGPHGAQADTCAAKKEARQLAWGWKPPPRPCREKGAKAPEAPKYEAPAT